jgi:hypothetical protein
MKKYISLSLTAIALLLFSSSSFAQFTLEFGELETFETFTGKVDQFITTSINFINVNFGIIRFTSTTMD